MGFTQISLSELQQSTEPPTFDEWVIDFAAKSGAKQKNCTPGKSYPCKSICLGINRNCREPLTGQAKTYADWLTMQGQKPATATATPAKGTKTAKVATKGAKAASTTVTAPPAKGGSKRNPKIRTNDTELDKQRNILIQKYGKKTVEAAENNAKKILDDPNNNVFIRVSSIDTLNLIANDRWLSGTELAKKGINRFNQDARDVVEKRVMGADSKNTKDSDRPIYGYLGENDLKGGAHKHMGQSIYGTISVKLKSEVKDRATFTGSDSFSGGIASDFKSGDTPPPPNAASLVRNTYRGYDDNINALPPNQRRLYKPDSGDNEKRLRDAAKAKTPGELASACVGHEHAPYVEVQMYGSVKGTDIAEIHFEPKYPKDGDPDYPDDRPNPAIAKWAKANGVRLYSNGKELDLDEMVNPKTKTKAISNALDSKDFDSLRTLVKDIKNKSSSFSGAAGNPPDKILGTLYSESGYDGKPKVVSEADVTNAWESGGTLMIRGCDPVDGDRTKALKDFQSGDYFVGNGIYGNGTYVGHTGTIKNGKHSGYDAARAKFDAQDTLETVQKAGYIKPTGVTMRMALDKDANIITDTDLIREVKAAKQSIDDYHQTEKARIIAASPPDPNKKAKAKQFRSEVSRLKKEYANDYSAKPVLTVTASSQGVATGKKKPLTFNTYSIALNGKGKNKNNSLDLKGYTVREIPNRFSNTAIDYEVIDPKGNKVEEDMGPAFRANNPGLVFTHFSDKKKAIENAVRHHIEQQALKTSGLDSKPDDNDNFIDKATQTKLAQLDEEVETVKETLFGDNNRGISGRFATIKGYDAIAITKGWGKGAKGDSRFMNLLNRSKVLIQKDELDYKTAQKKVAG